MRNRRKNQTSPTILFAYAAGIVLGCAGLGYAAYTTIGDPVPDQYGCYREGPQSEVILAIDASTPRWDAQQQRAMQRYIDQVYASLGFNERLSVYTTEGGSYAALLSPQVQVCGVANDAVDLQEIGVSAPSPGYLVKEKERLYRKRVLPELSEILALEAEAFRVQKFQSPILEMLQSLSRMPSFLNASRLVLVSDFLQNSDTAKFCVVENDMPLFTNFKKRRAYRRVQPESFKGMQIDFLMLQRSGYGGPYLPFCRDEEELQNFFEDYAAGHGAGSVNITRLRHGFGE